MMSEASFASLGPTLLARKGGAKPAMRPQLTPLTEDLSALAAIADEQLEDLGWNDMGTDRENEDDIGEIAPAERSLILSKPKPASVAHRHDDPDEDELEADAYQPGNAAGCEDGDWDGDEGEDAESGPFEIIDPLAGAVVVPIGPHAAEHPAARRPAANEDTFDPAPSHPEVVRQQERLAQQVDAQPAEDAPLLWQKPAKKQRDAEPEGAPRKPSPARARAAGSKAARRAAFTLRLDTERHLKLRLAATMQGVSAQALVTEALDAMLGDMEELDALVSRMQRD